MNLERYRPDFRLHSVCDLTLPFLQFRDAKAVLLDFDNTIVPWSPPWKGVHLSFAVSSCLSDLIRSHGGHWCIVSNTPFSRNVAEVAHILGIPYRITKGRIKKAHIFQELIDSYRCDADKVLVVGDLVFDIEAARTVGCQSALVNPVSTDMFIGTRLFKWPKHERIRKALEEQKMMPQYLDTRWLG